MRVSNIQDFLGGADNVYARDIIRGEQIVFSGTVRDSDSEVIDITSYTITATAEFYTANVTVTSRNATVTNFQAHSKDDATLTVTKDSDPSTGVFTVTIPEDLADADDTAALDATNAVLTVVVYISYDDGGSPATIRKSRLLLFIRHSA